MIKSEIKNITILHKQKLLKVQSTYNIIFITWNESEERIEFQCPDFWLMIEKLCKKHKLMQYAPELSLEHDYTLFDVLDKFFNVIEEH